MARIISYLLIVLLHFNISASVSYEAITKAIEGLKSKTTKFREQEEYEDDKGVTKKRFKMKEVTFMEILDDSTATVPQIDSAILHFDNEIQKILKMPKIVDAIKDEESTIRIEYRYTNFQNIGFNLHYKILLLII